MLDLRPFDRLGRFRNDWLNANYHFSFAHYYDRERMGVGPLRVWNDDTIRAGTGFEPHPHRDMEIVTYVRSGAITHEDNLGHQGRVERGDIQVMSAGTGIVHGEWNKEPEDMQLFQIWIVPARTGVPPRWQTHTFPKAPGTLHVLASGRDADGDAGAIPLHQDAAVLGGVLPTGGLFRHEMAGRAAYLVPTRGRVKAEADGATVELGPRDGLLVTAEDAVALTALEEAEVVLVDVAP